MGSTAAGDPVEVAIVGSGIVGLVLAAGLHRRSIKVTVYEASSNLRESGAGIGFNIAAKTCMEMIDPAVITALRVSGGVPVSAADPDDPHDYLRWSDGYDRGELKRSNGNSDEPTGVDLAPGGWQRLYLKVDAGYKGIEGTRRDSFLEELKALFPENMIHFGKRLEAIEDSSTGNRVVMRFGDGTSALADTVIGCDGIRSRTRDFVQSSMSSPARPTYAHVRSYRQLLPMAEAADALGQTTASIYHNHIGPGANILHYPVAQNKMVNIAVFMHDPNDWAELSWTDREGPRSDIEAAIEGWHPRIKKLVSKLPERVPVLGVFDMHDHPLPRYHNGRVCVAGDAAHASSPHHGAGAGMGIEDALCLSVLMAEVAITVRLGGVTTAQAVATALRTYDGARRQRSQWLVNSSRRVCDLQQSPDFGSPDKSLKAETCFEEIRDRTLKIWQFDHMAMVRGCVEDYGRAINVLRTKVIPDSSI